jgi:hypothetical protein
MPPDALPGLHNFLLCHVTDTMCFVPKYVCCLDSTLFSLPPQKLSSLDMQQGRQHIQAIEIVLL